jgi:hypothetical protein
MDIYICPSRSTLIARFSGDGQDYSSTDLAHFQTMIRENSLIGSSVSGDEWEMPFREYLMSDKAIPYHKAWLIALQMTPA